MLVEWSWDVFFMTNENSEKMAVPSVFIAYTSHTISLAEAQKEYLDGGLLLPFLQPCIFAWIV